MNKHRILVWDLPVRVFHWLLVGSFVVAYATAESERQRDWHVAFGYAMLALIIFRLFWGIAGTRYARFSSFAFGPAAVGRYLRSLKERRPLHYLGHNPAGSCMIYILIVAALVTAASGYAVQAEIGPHWLEELHEFVGNAMLALVVVHVVGAIASSILHRENLPRAMVTGYKQGEGQEGIRRSRPVAALALVLGFGLLIAALLPGGVAPAAGGEHEAGGGHEAGETHRAPAAHRHGHDDEG